MTGDAARRGAAHPEPPKSIASTKLLLASFPKGHMWWRIHKKGRDALHFGASGANRFDAPAGEFGVLYLGADPHCAFIETFGHTTGTSFVSIAELKARQISIVRASRLLRLVDLRGEGLARIGADARIASGHDLGLAQRWSRAFHDHPLAPDGVVYRARHDPARTSAAVFERAARSLSAERQGSLADRKHAARLGEILDTYRFALVP